MGAKAHRFTLDSLQYQYGVQAMSNRAYHMIAY